VKRDKEYPLTYEEATKIHLFNRRDFLTALGLATFIAVGGKVSPDIFSPKNLKKLLTSSNITPPGRQKVIDLSAPWLSMAVGGLGFRRITRFFTSSDKIANGMTVLGAATGSVGMVVVRESNTLISPVEDKSI
jgi:hypothetical protein